MTTGSTVSTSWGRLIVAVAATFTVESLYTFFSRWPTGWFTSLTDFAVLGANVAIFLVTVLLLPIGKEKKILVAACGTPVLVAVLFIYGLLFVGFVFDDWL